MKHFLIVFSDYHMPVIIKASTRDEAMGYVIGKIASCEEVSEDFHIFH